MTNYSTNGWVTYQFITGLIMKSVSMPKTEKMRIPWPKLKAWSSNSTAMKKPASASLARRQMQTQTPCKTGLVEFKRAPI